MDRRWAWALTAILMTAGAPAAQAATVAPARFSAGPASTSLTRLVVARGGTAADAAASRYAYLRKLDSHLQNVAADRLQGNDVAASAAREGVTLTPGGAVQVDVYVNGSLDGAASALRDLGMQVSATSDAASERLVEGELPVSALTSAAGLGATMAIVAVQGFGVNTGGTLSQGDAAHHGPAARALGPTGAGVPVGIVSDSINRAGGGVAGSQASGDLPGPASTPPGQVQVLQDGSPGSSDEGRAMAEIVYDGAPGIRNVMFSTGQGVATRAAGIDNLVAHGAKVIADDTFNITEPFFQDGAVAQAVDRARAAGVTYLVSAGNRARQSWEGTYAPMTDPRGVSADTEDFNPGAGTDAVQTLGTFSDLTMFVELQWDEAWEHATTNLAVDVYKINAGTPVFQFTVDTDNIATGVPSEFVGINITGTVTLGIAIRRVAGTRAPFMKYIVGGTPTFTIGEYSDPTVGAIDPDASSARGALTVGAVAHNDAGNDTAESFSSRGPATRRFDVDGRRLAAPDVRAKPELAGADGVATSVTGFNSFFGTSAAAPSAAGVAALVRSANPALTVAGVASILTNPANAIDCTSALGVPDSDCGAGFILADKAVAQALATTPPSVTVSTDPGAPTGAGGFFTRNVAVTWTVTDGSFPVDARSGCDPSVITTDSVTTLTCTATSAGGPKTVSITVRRDASPPGAPAISGIDARAYALGTLPPASALGCSSVDPTSGVTSCSVAGYDAAPGAHTLTATAVNGAGLSSTAALNYSVLSDTTAPTITAATASPATFAVDPRGPAATLADTAAPSFTAATASPATFAVDPRGTAETAVPAKAHKGTSLRFTLTEAARVVFTVELATPGRKSGKRCVAQTKANRTKKACTRYTLAGRFAQAAVSGANVKPFSGRIGSKRLKPGRYRLTLLATDAAGNVSKPRVLALRVVKA